jgi:hypothetical protein
VTELRRKDAWSYEILENGRRKLERDMKILLVCSINDIAGL